MRVLYCNPVFFEYRLPFYKELVRLFDGEFYVMYSPVRYKMCRKEEFCARVQEVLGKNAIPVKTDHLFDTNSMKWDVMPDIEKGKRIPFTRGLMRAIAKVRPDVLITEGYFQWTPLVLLYGILHRVPVYMGYERTCWTERNAGRLKTWQRKLFNRGFAGFLVNGSETRKYLMGIGVPAHKIFVGGMSADSAYLKEQVERLRKTESPSDGSGRCPNLTFLFSGVVSERKGVTHLLEAWRTHVKDYPDDRLLIVGDGNQLAMCKSLCEEMPTVRFVGRVPYDEMPRYYAMADVYVLPTIEDNWSLVVPEAMACGLPVATSIYNGCYPELVQEGVNGFVFDTFRHETIVEVLSKFHRVDLKAMGEASVSLEEPCNAENSAWRVHNAIIGNIR
ncbi:MAG: glycosyltransferase family 4 protein [Bacteroidaceae bacterium]